GLSRRRRVGSAVDPGVGVIINARVCRLDAAGTAAAVAAATVAAGGPVHRRVMAPPTVGPGRPAPAPAPQRRKTENPQSHDSRAQHENRRKVPRAMRRGSRMHDQLLVTKPIESWLSKSGSPGLPKSDQMMNASPPITES